MFLLTTIYLIFIFSTISFCYKADCSESFVDPCIIYMTPNESTYQDIFLPSIDAAVKMVNDIGLEPTEKDPAKIEEENIKIDDLVDQKTMETFVRRMGNIFYRDPVHVVLVSDLNDVVLPSELTTETPDVESNSDPAQKKKNNAFSGVRKLAKKIFQPRGLRVVRLPVQYH